MLYQRLTQSFINGAAINGILLFLIGLNITALEVNITALKKYGGWHSNQTKTLTPARLVRN